VCANNISACTQQTHTYAHRQGQQVHEAQCRDKPINDTNIKLLSVVRGAPAGAHRARSSSCAELIVRGAPAGTTHPSLFASLSLSLSTSLCLFLSLVVLRDSPSHTPSLTVCMQMFSQPPHEVRSTSGLTHRDSTYSPPCVNTSALTISINTPGCGGKPNST
jgi:hypothetical protein